MFNLKSEQVDRFYGLVCMIGIVNIDIGVYSGVLSNVFWGGSTIMFLILT